MKLTISSLSTQYCENEERTWDETQIKRLQEIVRHYRNALVRAHYAYHTVN